MIHAFAITLYAFKYLSHGNIATGHTTKFGLAPDEKSMRKIAFDLCNETFPEDEGYQGHQVSLVQVDEQEIEMHGVKYVCRIGKLKE